MELRAVVLEGKFRGVKYKVGIDGVVNIINSDKHILITYKNGDIIQHSETQVFYIEY